jgi:hypothetical protein
MVQRRSDERKQRPSPVAPANYGCEHKPHSIHGLTSGPSRLSKFLAEQFKSCVRSLEEVLASLEADPISQPVAQGVAKRFPSAMFALSLPWQVPATGHLVRKETRCQMTRFGERPLNPSAKPRP